MASREICPIFCVREIWANQAAKICKMTRGEIVYYGRAIIQNFLEAVIPTAQTPNVNNGPNWESQIKSQIWRLVCKCAGLQR